MYTGKRCTQAEKNSRQTWPQPAFFFAGRKLFGRARRVIYIRVSRRLRCETAGRSSIPTSCCAKGVVIYVSSSGAEISCSRRPRTQIHSHRQLNNSQIWPPVITIMTIKYSDIGAAVTPQWLFSHTRARLSCRARAAGWKFALRVARTSAANKVACLINSASFVTVWRILNGPSAQKTHSFLFICILWCVICESLCSARIF